MPYKKWKVGIKCEGNKKIIAHILGRSR
jgi:translation initiation factor IF-1